MAQLSEKSKSIGKADRFFGAYASGIALVTPRRSTVQSQNLLRVLTRSFDPCAEALRKCMPLSFNGKRERAAGRRGLEVLNPESCLRVSSFPFKTSEARSLPALAGVISSEGCGMTAFKRARTFAVS